MLWTVIKDGKESKLLMMHWYIGLAETTNDIFSAIAASYEKNVTDEFLKPIINAETPGSEILKMVMRLFVLIFEQTDAGK